MKITNKKIALYIFLTFVKDYETKILRIGVVLSHKVSEALFSKFLPIILLSHQVQGLNFIKKSSIDSPFLPGTTDKSI